MCLCLCGKSLTKISKCTFIKLNKDECFLFSFKDAIQFDISSILHAQSHVRCNFQFPVYKFVNKTLTRTHTRDIHARTHTRKFYLYMPVVSYCENILFCSIFRVLVTSRRSIWFDYPLIYYFIEFVGIGTSVCVCLFFFRIENSSTHL